MSRLRSFEEKLLGPLVWCVLFTNCGAKADILRAPEHMGSNIGTALFVAEVFRKLFFAAVRRRETRLDRYLRHRDPPKPE